MERFLFYEVCVLFLNDDLSFRTVLDVVGTGRVTYDNLFVALCFNSLILLFFNFCCLMQFTAYQLQAPIVDRKCLAVARLLRRFLGLCNVF